MSLTLDDLQALREGWDFEAKLAQGFDGLGQLPRDLWETYGVMGTEVREASAG
jgi:ATP-dependent DNA helicase RecG